MSDIKIKYIDGKKESFLLGGNNNGRKKDYRK